MKQLTHALRIALPVVMIGSAHAETPQAEQSVLESINQGDWCEWLSNKPGTLYKNPDNPYIQEFQVFGRLQWQAAYLWGEDTTGYNFSDDYTEVRRARLGVSMKFLQYFGIKANVNMADDRSNSVARWPGGQKLGWGYEDFDEALISFDIKKAFDIGALDGLTIKYGRHKLAISHEAHESSKKIMTVERSAIANKVYGSRRPTGATIVGELGDWEGTIGVFSTDALTPVGGNTEFIGGWNDGIAYYGSLGYTLNDQWSFLADFVYNDADLSGGDDNLFTYKWAFSLSADYDAGVWGVVLNGIYGDNGSGRFGALAPARQGDFWGFVAMPYYWIVEDKLQAVVRYQYQGSQNTRGIRVNSRYVRRNHGAPVNGQIAGGRGNEHHSLYAGLNWLVCGHNLKFMTGLEYDWLNAPGAGTTGDVSALTAWFACRSYF